MVTYQPRQYNSEEDLVEEFRQLRAQTEDPLQKSELLTAEAEAKVKFREQAAHGKLIEAWKRLAMQEYPLASKFPQLVGGNTEEEIMATAKEAHEQLSSLSQRDADTFGQFRDQVMQNRANPYGPAGVLGGGSAPGSPYASPEAQDERWERNFAERFNNAPIDAYGQRQGLSPRDVDRYATQRFVNHIKNEIGFWGELTNSSYRGRRR